MQQFRRQANQQKSKCFTGLHRRSVKIRELSQDEKRGAKGRREKARHDDQKYAKKYAAFNALQQRLATPELETEADSGPVPGLRTGQHTEAPRGPGLSTERRLTGLPPPPPFPLRLALSLAHSQVTPLLEYTGKQSHSSTLPLTGDGSTISAATMSRGPLSPRRLPRMPRRSPAPPFRPGLKPQAMPLARSVTVRRSTTLHQPVP